MTEIFQDTMIRSKGNPNLFDYKKFRRYWFTVSMKINKDWHAAHQMPEDPTTDQRIKWHIGHARNCSCRSLDGEIREEIKRKYMNTHQEFWIFFDTNDHKALALWAADCADHVLPYFEEKYPEDPRPRNAIEALQTWINTGMFRMAVIRTASLDAHAAAREAGEDSAARFAARAAGQAVATAHVPTHAIGASLYALKAVKAANPRDAGAAVAREREWQIKNLPEHLHWWVTKWSEAKNRGLKV